MAMWERQFGRGQVPDMQEMLADMRDALDRIRARDAYAAEIKAIALARRSATDTMLQSTSTSDANSTIG